MRFVKTLFNVLLLCFPFAILTAEEVQPQIHAHAHNDYKHDRPLLDALDHGFCSIEADVFLVDGKLLVAHDRDKADPNQTLEKLYLNPLLERAKKNGVRIYRDGPTVILLIDIKLDSKKVQDDPTKALAESEKTYAELREVLKNYASLLTKFYSGKTETNAVTVIITGARPPSLLTEKGVRLAAYDGRIDDLDSAKSKEIIPLVSDNWTHFFQWKGVGEFPADEEKKLNQMVAKAHQQGRKIRFWGAPDSPLFWETLLKAEVDLINTDDLAGLEKFLQHSSTRP